MKITKEEVLHVATLAHLDIDEKDIDVFAEQLGEILQYVDALNQVDTDRVVPTAHAISLSNAFREDVQTTPIDRDIALENAPDKEEGYFLVPKVVE